MEQTLLIVIVLLFFLAKIWRYFVEYSEDLKFVRLLEPWYWFAFFNLILSLVTTHYDYPFALVGLLIQLALSIWFAISVGWIIQACPHKTGALYQSLFVRGKTLKFCYRCGTRLPKDLHTHLIKDTSWQSFLFQMPPYLFEYVVFWIAQALMVLITLFLVLRFLKNPDQQHQVVWGAVILVILFPPAIYSFGRFRRYLSDTKGLIWWEDLKNSTLTWVLVLILLWGLLKFL